MYLLTCNEQHIVHPIRLCPVLGNSHDLNFFFYTSINKIGAFKSPALLKVPQNFDASLNKWDSEAYKN